MKYVLIKKIKLKRSSACKDLLNQIYVQNEMNTDIESKNESSKIRYEN